MKAPRRDVQIAVIAAVAAIIAGAIGALAGGAATYRSNKAIQENQATASARGVARVYQSQFFSFGSRLHAMLDSNRVIAPITQPFQLSVNDKKILAAEMKPDGWATVANVEAGLRIFDDPDDLDLRKAAAGLKVPLSRSDASSYGRISPTSTPQLTRSHRSWGTPTSRSEPPPRSNPGTL